MFYLNFDTFLEYVEGIDIKKTGGMKPPFLLSTLTRSSFLCFLLLEVEPRPRESDGIDNRYDHEAHQKDLTHSMPSQHRVRLG